MSMPLLDAAGPLNTIFPPLTSFPPQTDSDDITIIVNRASIINKNNTIWVQNLLGAESRTWEQMGIANGKASFYRSV